MAKAEVISRLLTAGLCAFLIQGALPGAAPARTRAVVLTANYDVAGNANLLLANPAMDGKTIAGALRTAGISDTTLVSEATAKDWSGTFDDLLKRLSQDDVVLVYIAGHGFQLDGRNYFLSAEGDKLISMDRLVQMLSGRAKATILIVDACRDNPFAGARPATQAQVVDVGSRQMRSLEAVPLARLSESFAGLSQLSDLRGLSTVVLFSTEPGNVSQDGPPGSGSPFANIAARELRKRQSLDVAFRRISIAVTRATRGTDHPQSPWRQGDLSFDVYLAGFPPVSPP